MLPGPFSYRLSPTSSAPLQNPDSPISVVVLLILAELLAPWQVHRTRRISAIELSSFRRQRNSPPTIEMNHADASSPAETMALGACLDRIPSEIFNIIFAMAVEGKAASTDHSATMMVERRSKKDNGTELITIDMSTLLSCLLTNSRLRNASLPFQLMIMDNIKHSVTKVTSNNAVKDFYNVPNIAKSYHKKVKALEIDAHLLPHFQRNSSQPYQIATPLALLMFPNIETITAVLKYNDEGDFSDRSNMLEFEYVHKTVKRMPDGVKGDVEDFIFGRKGYQAKLEIVFAYGGIMEFEAYIRNERMKVRSCKNDSEALWKACFCEGLRGPED